MVPGISLIFSDLGGEKKNIYIYTRMLTCRGLTPASN